MTRSRSAVAVAALSAGLLLGGCASGPAAPALVQVLGDDDSGSRLQPATITVPVGTDVRWRNHGARLHVLVSEDGGFAAEGQALRVGETFTHRFDEPGSFVYRLTSLGDQPLVGVIEVVEP